MAAELISKSLATWRGDLPEGSGTASLESSGAGSFDLRWSARTEEHAATTNPEELLGAALASCFSMALANELAQNETPAEDIHTGADVVFSPAKGVTDIRLVVIGSVPGMDEASFRKAAERAKRTCPIGRALKGVSIRLQASLR